MDFQPQLLVLNKYIGKPARELPTPCLVLSKPTIERNTQRLLRDVEKTGVSFRCHVKTLKCSEVTRLMLGGVHKKVVVSTLREIRGLLPLAREGIVEEALYGLPCRPSALPELDELSEEIGIQIMIDNEAHVEMCEEYNSRTGRATPWTVFIKIDMGSRRAGAPLESPRLKELIKRAEASDAVKIHGFYCHAGHSYDCKTTEAAAKMLHEEVDSAREAADMMSSKEPIWVSFGATPTAHVVRSLSASWPERLKLELHAGNFPANDLQQLSTGSIQPNDLAVRVLAEVVSVYPERNEAIINAGTLALAKETSDFPGYANLVDAPHWYAGRLSQEHGILVCSETNQDDVTKTFKIGQKLFLNVQHACITSANYDWYAVIDEQDVVREIWYPWRGW